MSDQPTQIFTYSAVTTPRVKWVQIFSSNKQLINHTWKLKPIAPLTVHTDSYQATNIAVNTKPTHHLLIPIFLLQHMA